MEIVSCGYNHIHDKDFLLKRPFGLEEYLLLVFRSDAVVEFEDNTISVEPFSVILIKSGTPHTLRAGSGRYINDWVGFTLTSDEEDSFCGSFPTNRVFCSSNTLLCSEIIRLMDGEYLGQSMLRSNSLSLLFKILFNKYYEIAYDPNLNRPYYRQLTELRNQIYEDPVQKYSVDLLADEVHLSKPYFHRLYKQYFNVSPVSDILTVKTEYAKQLLTSTNYPISVISEKLGYPNESQFIKQFKKKTGKSPLKFRNS